MSDDHDLETRATEAQVAGGQDRRTFLTWLSSLTMAGGLLMAYGTLAAVIGRFLYPAKPADKSWLFVREAARIAPGESLPFNLPSGSPVHITRRGTRAAAADFIALSSTCPHLGCQVHWQAQNDRFFCPCHNGVFTAEGKAIAGPPADAGQALLQFPLRVDRGLLFIQAPPDLLAAVPAAAAGCGPCGSAAAGRRS